MAEIVMWATFGDKFENTVVMVKVGSYIKKNHENFDILQGTNARTNFFLVADLVHCRLRNSGKFD